MKTSRLRVTLREVEPAVVRVLDVPADVSLPELHDLLQAAVGWTDSHLHEFVSGEQVYGTADGDAAEWQRNESGVALRDLASALLYRYDFGDGWEHDVEVLGPGDEDAGLRHGEGACPPEDCGGPGGYEQLREIMTDPAHPEHAAMRAWVGGDLPAFDEAGTALLVRDTVGAVPESVRLVLDLIAAAPGGGVKLTPGGRLPRAFVREVQARRPNWYPLGRPASIEEDLLPLAALHELLRRAGLLRMSKGVLIATRAARSDDREVIGRLRARFPAREFDTLLAERAVALLAAEGSMRAADLAELVHPTVGRWACNGRPLTVVDVLSSLWAARPTWEGLDLIATEHHVWHPGPSARRLLPTATALAHLWGGGQLVP